VASSLAGHGRYVAAVAITIVAVVSQYFLPQSVPALRPVYGTLVGDLAVVYGIPIVACLALVGPEPVRHWRVRMRGAAISGLSWYGVVTIIAIAVVATLTAVYEAIDPSALTFLTRENPQLVAAAANPWFYVGLSFLVGACEETIFRGWIFGYWRGRTPGWVAPAVASSLVFAGVHLYYGFTYGPASPLVYVTLFALGMAFAQTYRQTGGNLVVVALLHGVNDATAFLTLVIGVWGIVLHYGVVALGLGVALVVHLQQSGKVVPGAPPPEPEWPYADGERMSSIQMPSGPS
jgi:membrane protease YdiL (CAAX protease family)